MEYQIRTDPHPIQTNWLLEWLPKWCCFPVRAYCSLLFISFIYSVLCPWSPTLCTALWTQLGFKIPGPYGHEVLAVRTYTVTADPWKLSCENVSPSQNVTITIMLPHGHKNAFQFVYLYLRKLTHKISPQWLYCAYSSDGSPVCCIGMIFVF